MSKPDRARTRLRLHIVTDGETLKVADNAEWAIKEAVRFQRGVHVIDLADLRKRVRL